MGRVGRVTKDSASLNLSSMVVVARARIVLRRGGRGGGGEGKEEGKRERESQQSAVSRKRARDRLGIPCSAFRHSRTEARWGSGKRPGLVCE